MVFIAGHGRLVNGQDTVAGIPYEWIRERKQEGSISLSYPAGQERVETGLGTSLLILKMDCGCLGERGLLCIRILSNPRITSSEK